MLLQTVTPIRAATFSLMSCHHDGLQATDWRGERFCDACKETVFLCSTVQELEEHTLHRRCVAFDVGEFSETPSESGMPVRVVLLNGDAVPLVHVPSWQQVAQLKAALSTVAGIPPSDQRVLLGERELLEEDTLRDVGVTPEVTLTLVRVEQSPVRVRRLLGRRKVLTLPATPSPNHDCERPPEDAAA